MGAPPRSSVVVRAEDGRKLGQYRLITEIARGGMGVVHLAALCGLHGFRKLVVVKELLPELLQNEEAVAMFMDEARLAARLSHPNIVQTMEVGVDAGRRFIAMEYLDGQPLQQVVRRGLALTTRIPLRVHLAILLEVLAALEYAHNVRDFDGSPLGVVHRDVSPHNVFVTYEGHIKLVDFGISKNITAEAEETRAGVLKGKMRYMAPEQAAGASVDRRADLFSVGVMLWEAIVGRRAWEDQPDMAVLQSLLSGVLPSVREARADVDPDLARIVERAMSVDPALRNTTALEMREDLERYVTARRMMLPNARSLGSAISRLFADERDKRHALVGSRLRELSGGNTTHRQVVSAASAPGLRKRVAPGEATFTSLMSGDGVASSTAGSSISAAPPPTGGAWSFVWPVAMAAGLGTLFALTFVTVDRIRVAAKPVATVHAAANRAAANVPILAAPAAAPALSPRSSHVVLMASPESSRMYLDDVAIPNPYVAEQARDVATHSLRVEAPGYEAKTRAITFADNLNLEIDLAKERPPPRPAPVEAPKARPVPSATKNPPPFEPDTL